MKKILLLLFAMSFFSVEIMAQSSKSLPLPKKIREAEGITEYELGNGLKVLLFPDQSKQTITVNITYLVGSRHEGYGETGMAHLLEHLVFKGTKEKHREVAKEISDHGADFNGTTWLDRTNYFETFSATDENLDWALDMEADRMVNSRIAKEDLETEMTVVRNEFEIGENSPAAVLNERITSAAFIWHNYGNSTIGARSDIEQVPIENLQAFYRKYYQPDNAVLLIAGKFDPSSTLKLVNQKFGPIPRPERILPKTFTIEPTQDGEREVILRRTGDVQAIGLLYHVPSGLHPDFVAVDVMGDLLTYAPGGKLYKEIVETQMATNLFAWSFQLKEPGLTYFGAEIPKGKSVDSVKTAMIKVIEGYAETPPSQEELDRIKNKNKKNIELLLNDASRVGLTLSEFIAMGDWRMLFYSRDLLEQLKPEDISRVAKKYFINSNRTVGIFIPTEKPVRADIPEAEDVATVLKNYVPKAAVEQGEDFDPSPDNIDSRTHTTEEGDLEFAFLPKKTRGSSVFGNLVFRYGNEKDLRGTSVIADLTSDMLSKGTQKRTRQEFQDELDKLKARVSISGGAGMLRVGIETTKENLIPTIKLVAEAIKMPAFDQSEFDKLVQENLTAIEGAKSEPSTKAQEALAALMNKPYDKDDVRYRMNSDEAAEAYGKANLDQVKEFYETKLGGSNNTISFVGDFDEKEVQEIISAEFGDWKSPLKYQRVPKNYFSVEAKNMNIETPDKASGFFFAMQPIQMKDSDPNFPAMALANYMLGGGSGLSSRLMDRIRQKEGLSYGVGSQFSAPPIDDAATFFAYAIYAPENRDKVESAFIEEIEKMLKDGFTEKEISEAKKSYAESNKVDRSQDNRLVGTLNGNLFLDRTMAWEKEFETKIQNLSKEDILNAVRKIIDVNKMAMVKAGDFEGASKKAAEKAEKNPDASGAIGGAK